MSVSFYVVQPVTGWIIECSCGSARLAEVFSTHAAATAVLTAGQTVVCEDEYCAAYRPYVVTEPSEADKFEVNMSNVNAAVVLEALGYGEAVRAWDLAGQASADDLHGRIVLAEGLAPVDEGLPAYREGNMINCGREPGYLQTRLADLTALVAYAQQHELTVAWS